MNLTERRQHVSREIAERKRNGDKRGLGQKIQEMQSLTLRALLTLPVPNKKKIRDTLRHGGRL